MKAAGHWDLPRRGREGRRLCLHFSHKSRWKPSRAFPLAAGLAGKPRTAAPEHAAMRTRCGAARRTARPGPLASPFGGRGRSGRGAPPRYRASALGLSSLPGNLPPLPAAALRRPGPGPPTAPLSRQRFLLIFQRLLLSHQRRIPSLQGLPLGPQRVPLRHRRLSLSTAPWRSGDLRCFTCSLSGNGQFLDRHCQPPPPQPPHSSFAKSLLELGLQVI